VSGIKWHEVTWYSKLGAIILFLGVVPALCFYIGTQYQLTKQATLDAPSTSQNLATLPPAQDVIATTTGEKIPGADPATFVALNKVYGKDAYHVYGIFTDEENAPLPIFGADLASFQVMSGGYAKDVNYVYWDSRMVKGADPKTIISFGELPYAKDNSKVYWRTWAIVPALDPSTFTPIDTTYVKDVRGIYFICPGGDCVIKIEGADPQTFEVVRAGVGWQQYSKDKKNVYYKGKIIAGADTSTFQAVPNQNNYDSQDKNRKYKWGQIVQ
jgi:hypothetical protein